MQEKKFGFLALVAVVGLVLGWAAGVWMGYHKGARAVRVEAVKNGHAQHVIIDEYGRTEFRWLNPAEKK